MATDRFILQHWFMIIRINDKVIKVCLVPHFGMKPFPSIFGYVLNQLRKHWYQTEKIIKGYCQQNSYSLAETADRAETEQCQEATIMFSNQANLILIL